MHATRGSKWKPRDSGAAVVEMAITLPVLILLIMGCIDFGRFACVWIAVTNAARAGAGVGIVSRYPDPDPTVAGALVNWQKGVCNAVADELGMGADFTPAGSGDPDGYLSTQGLYVRASRHGETGGLWRAEVTARCGFAWWSLPGEAQPQQTVVARAIR